MVDVCAWCVCVCVHFRGNVKQAEVLTLGLWFSVFDVPQMDLYFIVLSTKRRWIVVLKWNTQILFHCLPVRAEPRQKGCELLLLVNKGLQLARPWVAGISRVSECEHEHSSTVVRQGRRWTETNTKRKLVVIQVKPCFIVWLAEVTSQSSWRITIWCTILRNIFYPALLLISPPLLLPPPAPIPYTLFVLAIISSLCTSLASWRLMNFLSLWIQWLLW